MGRRKCYRIFPKCRDMVQPDRSVLAEKPGPIGPQAYPPTSSTVFGLRSFQPSKIESAPATGSSATKKKLAEWLPVSVLNSPARGW